MEETVTTTLREQAIEAARLAEEETRRGLPGGVRLRSVKHLRDLTDVEYGVREALTIIDAAAEQTPVVGDLSRFLVKSQRAPGRWLYAFPNGHEASVILDLHRPFRFEVLSDDPADKYTGRLATALSTEEVEAKLAAIFNLPAVETTKG